MSSILVLDDRATERDLTGTRRCLRMMRQADSPKPLVRQDELRLHHGTSQDGPVPKKGRNVNDQAIAFVRCSLLRAKYPPQVALHAAPMLGRTITPRRRYANAVANATREGQQR